MHQQAGSHKAPHSCGSYDLDAPWHCFSAAVQLQCSPSKSFQCTRTSSVLRQSRGGSELSPARQATRNVPSLKAGTAENTPADNAGAGLVLDEQCRIWVLLAKQQTINQPSSEHIDCTHSTLQYAQ